MNAAALLFEQRAVRPEHAALVFDTETLSYEDLAQSAQRMARLLADRGVHQGDRVAIFLPNCPDFVIGYFGALTLGAIAVSIGAASSGAEAAHILRDSGAKALLVTQAHFQKLGTDLDPDIALLVVDGPEAAEALARAIPLADPVAKTATDPAAIVYSSGTTGRPKGVVLSHGTVDFVARSKVRYMGVTPDDRLLLFLPLHHCFGQNAVMCAAIAGGATLILQPGFDPARVSTAIAHQGVTMVFAVPSILLVLYDRLEPGALGAVRYWFSAAATLAESLETRWQATFGLPIHQGYGLSECGPFASYNHLDGPRPGRVGTPIEGVEMRLADPESGAATPAGATGEILIRGPNVMLGYWNRPAETAEAFRDGWLRSGDLGRVDADGYFSIVDRVKDMILVGGENVYPAEVENVLYGHPAIAEVAVYGAAEPYLGEEVRARVVLRPGAEATERALLTLCRAELAPFKVPSLVEFAEDLPKGPTGKILKRLLREEALPIQAAPESLETVAVFLSDWLGDHLGLNGHPIDPEKPFADYGLDSALGVALVHALNTRFELTLDPTLVWEYPSLNSLAAGIAKAQSGA